MQAASERVPSGMMSVFVGGHSRLGLAMLAARKWCDTRLGMGEPAECAVANFLFARCKVVGGHREALDFIELNQKEFNINRIKWLPVSGAFHTRLMQSAESPLNKCLKNTHVNRPLIRFYANVNGLTISNPAMIKRALVNQVSSPVKWEQTLNNMLNADIDDADDDGKDDKDDKETGTVDKEDDYDEDERDEKTKRHAALKKKLQSVDRVYPDFYECGPGSQSGPILREINTKAYTKYKHIGV